MTETNRPVQANGLFEETGKFRAIRRWAHYWQVSPWTVLAAALTRIAAEEPWTHRIRGLTGGKHGAGTAALYNVMVGPSSIGKSESRNCATAMLQIIGGHLPEDNRDRQVKTPEGMVAFFIDQEKENTEEKHSNNKPVKKIIYTQRRFQALGWTDELSAVIKPGGVTKNEWLIECLSSGYTGQWSERAVRTDPTPAAAQHTHFSLLSGGQDTGMYELLNGIGRTQGWGNRLILFDAAYPALPEPEQTNPEPPPRLKVKIIRCGQCVECGGTEPIWMRPEHPNIPKEIARRRWENVTGNIPAGSGASGHYLLALRRLSHALAVLHEAETITEEHWRWAHIIQEHSDNLRNYLDETGPLLIGKANEPEILKAVLKSQAIATLPGKVRLAFIAAGIKGWQKSNIGANGQKTFILSDISKKNGRHPQDAKR